MDNLPNRRTWLWIFILFVLLQIGDGLSTYILVTKTFSGKAIEANPFVRYVIDSLGILPGLLIVKVTAILIGYSVYAWILKKESASIVRKAFILGVIFYILGNIWNWYLVYYVMTA